MAFAGEEIRVNDRIAYLLVDRPGKRYVKGETLERALDQETRADRMLYLDQLRKTMKDLTEIVLGPILGAQFNTAMNKAEKMIKSQ